MCYQYYTGNYNNYLNKDITQCSGHCYTISGISYIIHRFEGKWYSQTSNSFEITRWQGNRYAIGFLPTADPTVLYRRMTADFALKKAVFKIMGQ